MRRGEDHPLPGCKHHDSKHAVDSNDITKERNV